MGAMSEPFRINRVVLKNYRSIADCDVELKNLTFLSGPNGSGKSNFLDALHFVSDSMLGTLDLAVRERGGMRSILHKATPSLDEFAMELDCSSASGDKGRYSFTLKAGAQGGFLVLREHCSVLNTSTGRSSYFSIAPGRPMESSIGVPAVIAQDRLHLVQASSATEFRPLYLALATMGFYDPSPFGMKTPIPNREEMEDYLLPSAGNVAKVMDQLARHHPWIRNRIEAYLKGIVPNLATVDVEGDAHYRYLRFKFEFPAQGRFLSFGAESMSDGTLRALGVLVAVFQQPEIWPGKGLAVVGIEEPETALHPAAARVLFDALTEAAESRQLIVSTHSPDLLDSDDVEVDSILAVQMGEDGATQIGALNEAGRSVLRDRLYTPGELMRINHLQPRREVSDSLKLSDRVDIELSPDEQ